MVRPTIPLEVRLERHTVKRKLDGCWEWFGHKDYKGYGRIFIDKVNCRVHRVVWELNNGPIPEGLLVCHRCDNPGCVRPDHLFLATNDENMADMVAKGRAEKRHNQEGNAMRPEELANRMARHIIGESLAAEDETCRKCIEMAREFRNAALEEAARVATEFHFDVDYVNADTAPLAIAAAIRALK